MALMSTSTPVSTEASSSEEPDMSAMRIFTPRSSSFLTSGFSADDGRTRASTVY